MPSRSCVVDAVVQSRIELSDERLIQIEEYRLFQYCTYTFSGQLALIRQLGVTSPPSRRPWRGRMANIGGIDHSISFYHSDHCATSDDIPTRARMGKDTMEGSTRYAVILI